MPVTRLQRPSIAVLTATGGDEFDIAIDGLLYRVHRFTESDDFEVTAGSGTVEALIVAGGGGGGSGTARACSGGGAGGLILRQYDITVGTYPVVVGDGGAGGATSTAVQGSKGGDSSVFGATAEGGGGGARNRGSAADDPGGSGGSGGGSVGRGIRASGVREQGTHGNSVARGSAGASGGGLNLTLNFDGVPRTYSAGGPAGSRNSEFQRQPVDLIEFGWGGRGANVDDSTGSRGQKGGPGIVIIRYPVRSV